MKQPNLQDVGIEFEEELEEGTENEVALLTKTTQYEARHDEM